MESVTQAISPVRTADQAVIDRCVAGIRRPESETVTMTAMTVTARKSRRYGEYLTPANNHAVARRWAARDGEYATSGNLMFRGASIYSYGVEIGRWIDRDIVVIATNRRSSSTVAHQTLIRRALPGHVQVIDRVNIVTGFVDPADVAVIREAREAHDNFRRFHGMGVDSD